MLTTHHALAFVVLAVTWGGGVWALWAYRRGHAGIWLQHVLALAQTLLIAQVALGLLLLSRHYRALAAPCIHRVLRRSASRRRVPRRLLLAGSERPGRGGVPRDPRALGLFDVARLARPAHLLAPGETMFPPSASTGETMFPQCAP